nr:unnamed protein product [Callosobruchus analis]
MVEQPSFLEILPELLLVT